MLIKQSKKSRKCSKTFGKYCMSIEEVSRRTATERKLIKIIRKRQLEFLGHAMRKDGVHYWAR